MRDVAGAFVARGPHLGADAVRLAAQAGLKEAGLTLDGVAVPGGEDGSAALLVRQVGGRVYQLDRRGFEDGHWALLPDRSALVDGSCVIRRSTRGVGEAIWAAGRRGATRVLLLLPANLQHDLGEGLLDSLGFDDRPLAPPCPVVLLAVHAGRVPAATSDDRRFLERVRTVGGSGPLAEEGSLGPALALIGGTEEPAAAYLGRLLGVHDRVLDCRWILTNADRLGEPRPGDLVTWLVQLTQEAGCPLWVLVATIARGYRRLLREAAVGLYPIAPGSLSERQLERRERHLLQEAAYRVGVFMGGTRSRFCAIEPGGDPVLGREETPRHPADGR